MINGHASSPLPYPRADFQRGRSRAGMLTTLALLAALGAGGAWWWTQRTAADGAGKDGAAGPAGAASAAGGAANRRFGGANRVQPVSVVAAQSRDMRVMINAIGNMAAMNTAIVRAKVDGELKAIRFKEGQPVRAGALLAQLDARSYEAALAQVQGQLARDQAQLRNAQIDLERYKDLLAKDSIAKQQVDTQDALVKQLQGTVQTDQAQVDSAKLQLSYTQVVAPISGRLGLKQVDLGSIVRSSDANGLVSITQTQPIALVFAVPESNLVQINRKLKGKDPLLVEVWDREQRNRLGQGKVITTDNAIDTTTGTIKLKAEFANADGSLFPNQFVNVRLQVETQVGVIAVPSAAIQRGAQGIFVYVVKEDNTVTMRRVRLGTTEGDWVGVQGEVAAGDKVVTDGADRLREGAKVDVIAPVRPGAGGGMGGAGGAGGGQRRDAAGASTAPAAPASSVSPASSASGAAAANTAPATAPATTPANADASAAAPAPAKRGPSAAAAGAAPAAAPTAQGSPAASGDLPPWFDRMPPEMQERFKKMNPEERKVFLEKARERRRQREADGG